MKNLQPGHVRFLHAIEHAVLRTWLARFGIVANDDVAPPFGEDGPVDWRAALDFDDEEWDESRLGVRPKRSAVSDSRWSLENAVARLCLEDVYDETPSSIRTRRTSLRRRVTLRDAKMRSSHLISIDWADDSGSHHFVSYYWTWIPYYECSVISSSSFTPDPHSAEYDGALYAFSPAMDLLEASRRTLLAEWARLAPRRARFMDFGLIDAPLAKAWAERARAHRPRT